MVHPNFLAYFEVEPLSLVMACDLEALFTVEQKLRMIFANPSFVRSCTRLNFADSQGSRLLPFQAINSLGDPQQHLLQAMATSMSLLSLQEPLIGNFARWCSSHDSEFDLEVAASALKQLLSDLRLPKGHVNAIYADSRVLGQLIRNHGVLDDPTSKGDDGEVDAALAIVPPHAMRTMTSGVFKMKSSTWELKVLRFDIRRAKSKYKKASQHLDLRDGFFSPRLQPHANSPKDGWYIRACLGSGGDSLSLDHWFSPIFPKSMQISLTPNLSFIEELGAQLADGSDQDVIAHLREYHLIIEIWRHKPKRPDFPLCMCGSSLRHQSLGLAAASLFLEPLNVDVYHEKSVSGFARTSEFAISATVELSISRRKAVENKIAEPLKPCSEAPPAEAHQIPGDGGPLRTELDSEVAVLRNWTFMGAVAALLVQHDAQAAAINTIMLLYCFTSGFAFVHVRDCYLIARALNMKCDKGSLVNALELLLQLHETERPRNYSASDVYSLVDTTRIALRASAADLIVIAARHYLDNIMAHSHELQRSCLPVLLKIVSMKTSFDEKDRNATDCLMVQLHFAIQSWNTFTMQSIRRLKMVLDASSPQMQNLLTVSNMFRMVSHELEFQLTEIAPLYPSEILPKQTIARNLCSHVVVYAQAFLIEGSDDNTFDSDLLMQLFEALLCVIGLLKRHECSIEAESISQLFQEMFPLWLSSIEITSTRQLECALAMDDMTSLTGIRASSADCKDEESETLNVVDSLFKRCTVLLAMPKLDADLHQLFWDVVLRVGHHAASSITSAFSRDIQYILIVEGGLSDSDADSCIAACAFPLTPAQFLSDLDASRKGINGSYVPTTSWGRVMTIFSSPLHFLAPATLHRAAIAHSVAILVREFATYELNLSDDPMIALLPHASLISLADRFMNIFNQAFLMACNLLTAVSLHYIELALAQEEINAQTVADEIYRMCQEMRLLVRDAVPADAASIACALVVQAVTKACVMAAMQMQHSDVDGISFLDAIQVKITVQLQGFLPESGHIEERYNHSNYLDLFKCLTRTGVENDLGVLLKPTQDLVFEYSKMRNGKVSNSPLSIQDLQTVLVRRARSGDPKAVDFLNAYVEEPRSWRRKFDVLDSEASFLVVCCQMRQISVEQHALGAAFSNNTWFHGVFVLTKFHCAFVEDDAEDNSGSICYVLPQLSQFVANLPKSTITLNGLPKISRAMFHIRVHVVELVGIAEEVSLRFSLQGQIWYSAPLRLVKVGKFGAMDSGSPWIESRLHCKDLPEAQYPSKYQLAESPPLAVFAAPASLTIQISKGSHQLGQGMIPVGELSSLVVNDLLVKVDLAHGQTADVRVFVTVVPQTSLQQNDQKDVQIELRGFARTKEITERFASHLSDIGLDDSVSVKILQEHAAHGDSAVLRLDLSNALRSGERPLGSFRCTWIGQGAVFNRDVPGTLVVTDDNIYFFNRDLSKVLDVSVHMISENGLKKIRHRLSVALSIQVAGDPGLTHRFCNFGQGHLNGTILDQVMKLLTSASSYVSI